MDTRKALALYLKDPGSGIKAKKTLISRRSTLRRLDGDKPVGSWTENDLVLLLDSMDVSDSTKVTYRNSLRSFFGWCHWKGHTKTDPAVYLKKALPLNPQPVVKHNWLTEQQVAAVLRAVPQGTLFERRDHLMLQLGFTTALRATELSSLTWANVRLDERSIWLPRGKGGKPAEVAVTPNTHQHLADWRSMAAAGLGRPPASEPVLIKFKSAFAHNDGRVDPTLTPRWDEPMRYEVIRDRTRAVSAAVGIEFRPHDMRRTYGGLMDTKGFPVDDIKKAMRHSSSVTTERYLMSRRADSRRAQEDAAIDF